MITGRACRWCGPTSTPTRSSRATGSSASSAPGFGEGLFSEWRESSDFVLNQERYDGRQHPRRRAELRHRLVARARGVGAAGLRLRGRRLVALRRHLPQQLREDGPRAATVAAGRRSQRLWDAIDEDPSLELVIDVETRARRRAGDRPRRSRSSSTTSRSTGCSNGLDDIGLTLDARRRHRELRSRSRADWMPSVSAEQSARHA